MTVAGIIVTTKADDGVVDQGVSVITAILKLNAPPVARHSCTRSIIVGVAFTQSHRHGVIPLGSEVDLVLGRTEGAKSALHEQCPSIFKLDHHPWIDS